MADRLTPNGGADATPINLTALHASIRNTFQRIYENETAIAAEKAKHILPLQNANKALWRGLKKESNVERTDLDLFYRLYRRDQESRDLDEQADGERIRDNMRTVFTAMFAKGGQLDWISASEAADEAEEAPWSADEPAAPAPAAKGKKNGKAAKQAQPAGAEVTDPTYAGFNAGMNSSWRDANPYAEGSEENEAWDTGWFNAQKQLAAELGMNAADLTKVVETGKPLSLTAPLSD